MQPRRENSTRSDTDPVARRAPSKRTTANTVAILKALTHEATAVGLDSIAASSIAKRAGLTTGAIYNRFENNDEMLVALWEQVVAQKFENHIRQTIHYLTTQEKISTDPDLIARLERPSSTLALAAEFVVVAQRNEVVGEVVIPQITQWLHDSGLNKNRSPIDCAGV
jgi:AcrR family transcriptional regulator